MVSVPNNYHCNLNSKFSHLFYSLNITECNATQLLKGQGPVNLKLWW